MRGRLRQWMDDRKAKRSQAEIRLRTAESIAAKPFDLDLPELPPLGRLKAGGKADLDGTESGTDELVVAAERQAEGAQAATSAPIILVPAGASRPATLDANGVAIEFTSVPPQTVSGGAGPAGAAEAEKKALVQRILERKKAKPYTVPVDGILNTYPDGQYWVIDDKTSATPKSCAKPSPNSISRPR